MPDDVEKRALAAQGKQVAREAMAWATGLTVVATALAFLTR